MTFMWCSECHALIHLDGSGHFPYCNLVTEHLNAIAKITGEHAVTVPTQAGFDWGTITAHAVEKLRQPKTPPAPPSQFIALAQRSYEGVTDPRNSDGPRLHVLTFDFGTPERAQKAMKHLRDAGAHTTPPTSVRIVADPEREWTTHPETGEKVWGPEVSPTTLAWKAGSRTRVRRTS
jgi:hypothetical protein